MALKVYGLYEFIGRCKNCNSPIELNLFNQELGRLKHKTMHLYILEKRYHIFKMAKLGFRRIAAICVYLAEKYGNDVLIPTKLEQRAIFFQVCFYAMMELDAHTLYIIAKHGGSLMHYYKPSPEAVEVAIKGFNQQIVVADNLIQSPNYYVLGQQFTVADILLCTCLMSATRLATQFTLSIPQKLIS